MTRSWFVALALGFGTITSATAALADVQVYTYRIRHPIYGDIGMLTETVDRLPERTRMDSRLRIAVKLLGVVIYGQTSETTTVMRGKRLESLESVTEQDGRHIEVHGESQGDRFVVNTTAGSFAGPAGIVASDPWVLSRTGDETVVLPDTGRIISVHVSAGDDEMLAVNGALVVTRHFVAMGDTRQDVWLNARQVPILFRTVANGTTIDFVLQNATAAAGVTTLSRLERPAPALPGGDK